MWAPGLTTRFNGGPRTFRLLERIRRNGRSAGDRASARNTSTFFPSFYYYRSNFTRRSEKYARPSLFRPLSIVSYFISINTYIFNKRSQLVPRDSSNNAKTLDSNERKGKREKGSERKGGKRREKNSSTREMEFHEKFPLFPVIAGRPINYLFPGCFIGDIIRFLFAQRNNLNIRDESLNSTTLNYWQCNT